MQDDQEQPVDYVEPVPLSDEEFKVELARVIWCRKR